MPTESIRLDIVDLDDGYKAYYVDGLYHHESGEHDIREIIDLVNGKYVESITYRFLDNRGDDEHLPIELPTSYEDIAW